MGSEQEAGKLYHPAVGRMGSDHPDVATRFTKAYVRGARFYADAIRNGKMNGPTASQVIETLAKYSKLENRKIYQDATPPIIDTNDVESLKKDWAFFKGAGEIDGKVGVDDVVDTSYVERAVELVGPHRPLP